MVEAGNFNLALYDLQGRLVKQIASKKANGPQVFSYRLDVDDFPVGMYLVRLTTSQQVETERLVVK